METHHLNTHTPIPRRVLNFAQVLPNNDRVRNKMELEKLEEEERIKIEIEKQKKKEEISSEEILRIQQLDRERKQKLKDLENQKEDIKERTSQIQRMEGNLSAIIRQLMDNTSPYELNFSGLDLDRWNFTSLMVFLPDNKSLLTLNLSRKNFNDEHAKEIADMLKKNKKLRRLELAGNNMGPDSAKYLAEALKVNRTLKYLDLENNNFTNKGEDSEGIIALFEALRDNPILISINLNNNYLTPSCGQAIISCLRKNKILIHLETFQNQRFEEWNKENPKHPRKEDHNKDMMSKFVSDGLSISQVKEIKDRIADNRNLFDTMKKEEWIERKKMGIEHDDIINFNNTHTQKDVEENVVVNDQNLIENFYNNHFNKHLDELEKNFMENVNTFFADTRLRLEKKRKPGKK